MAESTSSAKPRELFAYSAVGRRINSELNSEACRLADALQHFQATCREYSVPAGHLPGQISSYAGQADVVDAWVRRVGNRFLQADAGAGIWSSGTGAAKPFLSLIKDFVKSRSEFRARLLKLGNLFRDTKDAKTLYQTLSHGIPYRDRMDRLLKSKSGQRFLDGLDFLVSVNSDVSEGKYGGDVAKAVGANATDAVMTKAIAASGVGALVLLANGLIQVGGNLQVAGQRTLSRLLGTTSELQSMLLTDAGRVEGDVKRMDVDNVIKAASETVYDVYLHPYGEIANSGIVAFGEVCKDPSFTTLAHAGQSMLGAVGKNLPEIVLTAISPGVAFMTHQKEAEKGTLNTLYAAGNVVDGAYDFVVDTSVSVVDMELAFADTVVSGAPLPPSFRNNVHTTLHDNMSWLQSVGDRANFLHIPEARE